MNEQPISFTIDFLYLKAASLAAAKKDNRAFLNGIYFNLKEGCLWATNGHIAFTTAPGLFPSSTECKGFIMRNSLLNQILMLKPQDKSDAFRKVEIHYANESRGISVIFNGITLSRQAEDLRFPDLSRVYPAGSTEPESSTTYSTKYIDIAVKIAKTMQPLAPDEKWIEFKLHNNSALLSLAGNLVHLIVMGLKNAKPLTYFTFKKEVK